MIPSHAILFVATSSNATPGGGRTRIVDVAREVKKRNFTPYILCFVYGTQVLSGPRFLAHGRARLEADSGCPVYYVPMLPFGRLALVDWLNNWFCGMLLAFFSRRLQVGIVYGHGVKAGHLGLFARKMLPRLKIVSDIQGLVVDEYYYERFSSGPDAVSRRMERAEAETLTGSNWLIVVSQAMRNHYESRLHRPLKNSALIPCATRADFHPDQERRSTLRREHGLEDKFVLCYAGSAEKYQLPGAMCRLFKELLPHMPDAFLLIFSHQPAVFERFLRAEGVDSACYKITSVPHSQIFDNLQMGDAGLLLRDDSQVNRVASPTKFAEYCLCGLPVLTTPYVGDFSEYVRQFSLGHHVDLSNLQADEALLTFLQDVHEHRAEYADRCAGFARQHLTWDVHGPALAELFTSLSQL